MHTVIVKSSEVGVTLITKCFIQNLATSSPEATEAPGCERNGLQFFDGELVPSDSLCEDCYCVEGTVICAKVECQAPAENCSPVSTPEGTCCPEEYECSK